MDDPSHFLEDSGRQETEAERLDRNLGELLGELRVALPGVQVLFAFLLVVPFNQRFSSLSHSQERVYLATLLFAALATALLIAPVLLHRLTFRLQDKLHLVRVGNRLAITGLASLAVAMVLAIFLTTDVVFGGLTAGVSAGAVAVVFAVLWGVLPALRRRQVAREREES